MGRDAQGVIGMKFKGDDYIEAFDVVVPEAEILIVTDAGYGKRTLLDKYPRHHRGGQGVKTVELTPRRGFIAGASVVTADNEVFLIASDGQVIRMPVRDISRQGRATTGVRVMRLDKDQQLVAMARVVAEDEDES